jgi:energy-coupling factor transporter ATP-binding protein EcfA2
MIEIKDLSFSYPGKPKPVLRNIDLVVGDGEFVLITGPTGCGKSTLLKCLNGIIPQESEGTMAGDVIINGVNTREVPLTTLSNQISLVQQNPDDQIFSLVVEDEVGFGPENIRLPKEEIKERVENALKLVGMTNYKNKSVHGLSGGQKQRVAIASMLAMQPSVLLLDEPASQLDPQGAQEVLSVITKINAKVKNTIILVEHRIHEVAHLVDRVVVMDEGRVVLDTDTKDAFRNHIDIFCRLGLRLPETVELFYQLRLGGVPLTEEEALDLLKNRLNVYPCSNIVKIEDNGQKGKKGDKVPAIRTEDIRFGYEDKNWILKGISLEIQQGEIVALLGNNGSGKSTLLLNLCGILKADRGDLEVFGRNIKRIKPEVLVGDVAVVFQDPGLMLFCDTVEKEVFFGPKNLKLKKTEIKTNVQEALAAMTIEDLISEPPQSLSGGQRLRAAAASVLSMKPRILLLDEPTSGQDKKNITSFMTHLKKLSEDKTTIVFITHDMETALKFADRIILLNDGKVVANGEPRALFANFDLLKKTSLQPPQSLTLSKKLGLKPSFCVYDLAKELKAVMAYV